MLPIAWYLLKVIICSGILYGYYWLLLRNKVFHKYNRFYLMAAVVLSLLLPLIKINFWQPAPVQTDGVIQVLQAVSNGDEYIDSIIVPALPNSFDITQLYPLAYLIVSLVLFIIFLHTLYSIFNLVKKYPTQIIDKISFVNTDAKSTPFSFFNYIFWNNSIDIETTTGHQIFKHELAHVQEKHSHDKIFINSILIFFWCNPFFWLIRKELNMIHEFIADKKAVEDSDTASFAAMILQATYPQHRFQLTNNFFYSPIKRRLLMLTKNKNPKINYFGRVMALPLLVLIFAAFTFKVKAGLEAGVSRYNGKKITVVIDAGHGGLDAGAKSSEGILEKNLSLEIAKKIKDFNTNDAIEIILTRADDAYMSPKEKAAFVKEKMADLFISIHLAGSKQPNEKSGIQFIVARNEFENAVQSKIFASALIQEFTANYPLPVATAPVQIEKGVWVLQGNNIPSVLIEAGYITNNIDLNFLKSTAAKESIAKNILAAIEKFYNSKLKILNPLNKTSGDSISSTGFYVNARHSDTIYLKSNDFKNKALVIVDSKEIGNFGMNYVEKNIADFSTIVTYNPIAAKKIYGEKGRYGVIKLTQKDAILISADTIFFDEKNNSVKLSGSKTVVNGDLSNALIYIDGKISTPAQLNAIPPNKISNVTVLKGDKLDDIIDAKGKTAMINVTLKADDLKEVVVVGYKKPAPLYVVDGKVKEDNFNINIIAPDNIESINVLKGNSATLLYGEKGKNGVVEIKTKNKNEVIVQGYKKTAPLYIINGKESTKENADKINPERIEDVRVIKETTALEVYGEKGKNGVVIINLKPEKSPPYINTLTSHGDLNNQGTNPYFEVDGKEYIGYTLVKYMKETGIEHFDDVKMYDKIEGPKKFGSKANDGAIIVTIKTDNVFKVFTKTEIEPSFAGGDDEWRKYLMKNLKSDIPSSEGWKTGSYTIIIQFIVHKDGTVSDVTSTNYQNSKTAQHCIDLIKQCPNWKPAIQNGRAVNAYRKQPITFVVEEDKKSVTATF